MKYYPVLDQAVNDPEHFVKLWTGVYRYDTREGFACDTPDEARAQVDNHARFLILNDDELDMMILETRARLALEGATHP